MFTKNKIIKIFINPYFLFLIFLLYLILGTGIHGDEYTEITNRINDSFFDFFKKGFLDISIFYLPSYFLFWWSFTIISFKSVFFYDLIKVIIIFISFVLIFKFISNYIDRWRAFTFSVFFILFPTHDTTTYWLMTNPYILMPALIMFSHYKLDKDKYYSGLFFGFLGAFMYYGSIPYFIGLSFIFLMRKNFKKSFIFLLPPFIYLIFYLYISYFFLIERRFDQDLTLLIFIKNIFGQFLSTIDVLFGPSIFLKIYYSLLNLTFLSFLIGILFFILFILIFKFINISENIIISKHKKNIFILFFSFFIILFFSMIMFSFTSLYFQTTFNLSNRTTVYLSLIPSLFFAIFFKNKFGFNLLFIFLFIIINIGIANHWKIWNLKQQTIINNIFTNHKINIINLNDILIVEGCRYSKFSNINHIEFFSMPWLLKSVFVTKNNKSFSKDNVYSLSKNLEIKNNYIINNKFNYKTKISGKIYLYNCEKNNLSLINSEYLNQIIKFYPLEIRHWIQTVKQKNIYNFVTFISLRLNYLFQ